MLLYQTIRRLMLVLLILGPVTPWADEAASLEQHVNKVPLVSCSGPLAAKVWQKWDDAGQANAQQLLQARLVERGDTYVLYDLELQLHNLLAMSVRCGDLVRTRQLAQLVETAYSRLEPDDYVTPLGSPRRQWVCRGGAVCNEVNRRVNTEVMLTSVQFLAFATDAANALHADPQATSADKHFALQSAQVAIEHLMRWGTAKAVQALKASLKATPDDVKDGASRYFLTDKVLWQLSIYANLAGMLQRDPHLQQTLGLSRAQLQLLRVHAGALVALVQKRTVLSLLDGSIVQVADLDAGYWRYYKDNRYAAYEGNEKPAACKTAPDGSKHAVILRHPGTVPIRDDIGWDVSHARRLVHYLSTMHLNRLSFAMLWQVSADRLPDELVMRGFAQQLASRVWNQNAQYPLFTNYFSGANGWYRIAYDNGTGRCNEGIPPYGLANAFAVGGFVTWGAWLPQLRSLGWRVYELSQSKEPADRAFVARHYPGLGSGASAQMQLVQQLMFLPTLIEVP